MKEEREEKSFLEKRRMAKGNKTRDKLSGKEKKTERKERKKGKKRGMRGGRREKEKRGKKKWRRRRSFPSYSRILLPGTSF